jgi:type IV pilus modification protein PilV
MRTKYRSQEPEARSQKSGDKFRFRVTDHRSRITRRTGFSLVEVTLAVAVVAIGLIAIIGLIPQGVQSSRDAADNTIAATIAHDALGELRSQPFDNIQICNNFDAAGNCIGSVTINLSASAVKTLDYDQAGFVTNATGYYKLTIKYDVDPVLPSLTRVTATVSWPAQSASPLNNITNVTLIARYQ